MLITASHLYAAIDTLPLDEVLKLAAEGANMVTVEGPLSDLEDEALDPSADTQMPGSSLEITERTTVYAECTNSGTMYSTGARK